MSDVTREMDAARAMLERRAPLDRRAINAEIREVFKRRFAEVDPQRIPIASRSAALRALEKVRPMLDDRGLKIILRWYSPETDAEREYAERWPLEWETVESVEEPGRIVMGMADRDRIPGIKSPAVWIRADLPQHMVEHIALHELGHIILDTSDEETAEAFARYHTEA